MVWGNVEINDINSGSLKYYKVVALQAFHVPIMEEYYTVWTERKKIDLQKFYSYTALKYQICEIKKKKKSRWEDQGPKHIRKWYYIFIQLSEFWSSVQADSRD